MIIEIEVGKHDVNNVRTTQSPVERKHTTNNKHKLHIAGCSFVGLRIRYRSLICCRFGGDEWRWWKEMKKKIDNTQNARVAAMCVYYMAIMHVNARSAHCTSNKWNIFHLNFHNMLALHWIVIVNAAVVHLAAPAIWLLTESLKKTTKPCTCTIYTFGYCHLPILIILLHIYVRENRKKK